MIYGKFKNSHIFTETKLNHTIYYIKLNLLKNMDVPNKQKNMNKY